MIASSTKVQVLLKPLGCCARTTNVQYLDNDRPRASRTHASLPMMRPAHIYWHIYPEEQIRPEFRGRLTLVLEVPWVPGSPVVRNIFDATGRDFPRTNAPTFSALLSTKHHGILYAGINKNAVYDLMLSDPPINQKDVDYVSYNREIVANARNLFLRDPNLGFKAMPQHMAQLL